jgi:hypothetical protein
MFLENDVKKTEFVCLKKEFVLNLFLGVEKIITLMCFIIYACHYGLID